MRDLAPPRLKNLGRHSVQAFCWRQEKVGEKPFTFMLYYVKIVELACGGTDVTE